MLTFATTLLLVLSAIGLWIKFKPIENGKTAVEWVKLAVEEEHYILDDDGYLLTHQVELQFPSIELIEETEGRMKDGYIYAKDDKGGYYFAIYKHTLLVDTITRIKEYTYVSAIAWRLEKRSISSNPAELKFTDNEIIDIDIAKVAW